MKVVRRRLPILFCCGVFFTLVCATWAQTTPGATVPTATSQVVGVVKPQLLHTVKPQYPREARKKRLEATSLIDLTVDTSGMPQDVHVIGSAADHLPPKYRKIGLSFDQSAEDAVQRYRFTPGEKDGKPVPVELHVNVAFHIL